MPSVVDLPRDTESLVALAERRPAREDWYTNAVFMATIASVFAGVGVILIFSSVYGLLMMYFGVMFPALLLLPRPTAKLDPRSEAARELLEAVPPTRIIVEGDGDVTVARLVRGEETLHSHRWEGGGDEIEAIDLLGRWREEATAFDAEARETHRERVLLESDANRFRALISDSADEVREIAPPPRS